MAPPSRGRLLVVMWLLVFLLEIGVQALKQGFCPIPHSTNENCAQRCLQDEACAADYKCCFNGCGRECLKPVDNPRKRHKGKTGNLRRGVCPPTMTSSQQCGQRCTNDHDCRGDYKCCPSASCGHECVYPLPPFAVNERQPNGPSGPKAGTCPPEEEIADTCDRHCSENEPCMGYLMCCNTNCGMQCVEPVDETTPWHLGVRVGNCPKPVQEGRCEQQCEEDRECPPDQKCCFNGCGYDCMPIISATHLNRPCPPECDGQCEDECQNDYGCSPGAMCFFKQCSLQCLDGIPGKDKDEVAEIHDKIMKEVCENHRCAYSLICEVELITCDKDDNECQPFLQICVYPKESCRHLQCEQGSHCFWRKPCNDETCRYHRECVPTEEFPLPESARAISIRIMCHPYTVPILFVLLRLIL